MYREHLSSPLFAMFVDNTKELDDAELSVTPEVVARLPLDIAANEFMRAVV